MRRRKFARISDAEHRRWDYVRARGHHLGLAGLSVLGMRITLALGLVLASNRRRDVQRRLRAEVGR